MANNVKIERLNHAFQQEISMILMTEIKDEDIKFVTITGVETTSDLGFAKVYFTVLDDTKKESTLEALNGAASFIRGELSKRVEIRHTPELKFIYDNSIEYGNHIEKIIEIMNKIFFLICIGCPFVIFFYCGMFCTKSHSCRNINTNTSINISFVS